MSAVTESLPCHAKGCPSPAVAFCDRCGHPCCTQHARPITIKRRDDPGEMPGFRPALNRLPTRVETYTLCLRCSTKPFGGKPPTLAL